VIVIRRSIKAETVAALNDSDLYSWTHAETGLPERGAGAASTDHESRITSSYV
jgi:hypothetical protein